MFDPQRQNKNVVQYIYIYGIYIYIYYGYPYHGHVAEVISYNALLNALEKAGQWNRTLWILNSMPLAQVLPDVISC